MSPNNKPKPQHVSVRHFFLRTAADFYSNLWLAMARGSRYQPISAARMSNVDSRSAGLGDPGLSGCNQFQIRAGDAKETLETRLTKTDGRLCKLKARIFFGVLCPGYFRRQRCCWSIGRRTQRARRRRNQRASPSGYLLSVSTVMSECYSLLILTAPYNRFALYCAKRKCLVLNCIVNRIMCLRFRCKFCVNFNYKWLIQLGLAGPTPRPRLGRSTKISN